MNLPLLGICYGHQLIVNKYGGKVKRANKEYGSSLLTIDNDKDLLNGVGESVRAWMSHGDEAEEIPPGFQVIGHTESAKAAAIASDEKSVYGIQFSPQIACAFFRSTSSAAVSASAFSLRLNSRCSSRMYP